MAGIELLSDQNFRVDGRRPHELRKISCRLGVFRQADGSAYIEQGNTKVLAAVYGPHEVRRGRGRALHDRAVVNCQFSMATFSTGERKRRPRGDRKSTEMTSHLQQTFDTTILTALHPRSQIDIFVEVLQADGGNYSACVNAATLALIDAGIPLKDYVCACSAGFSRETALVDMNHLEESSGCPQLTVAMLAKSRKLVFLQMTSRLHGDHLAALTDRAMAGCGDVHSVVDSAVRDYVGETAAALGGDSV
ncbi:Exosome complex component RRP41 [Nucella lapillus]